MSPSNSPTSSAANDTRYARNGRIIIAILMITALPSAALFGYFGYFNHLPQLYLVSATLIASAIFDLLPLTLIRRGQINRAMTIIIIVFNANILIVPFLVQGLGAIVAVSAIVVTIAIAGLSMSPNYSSTGIVLGIIFGIAALLADSLLGTDRIQIPQLGTYSTYIVLAIGIPIFIVLAGEFRKFSLQVKITLGILLTGGITVITLLTFGLNRTNAIVNTLSQRLETSIVKQTEAQITDVINTEAAKADTVFLEIQNDLSGIAEYRTRIENQSYLFNSGTYWNSIDKIKQLPGGQYGNSNLDPSSVFIPNLFTLDEAMIADLNASAYLDFIAPGFLNAHPEVVAVYYISERGYTTYYPNISLAENVPANFNPKEQIFYSIVTPQNDPEHSPKWTEPYQDPAGKGLIVTLSSPIYSSVGVFKGVIGADIQLSKISNAISNIKLGETGFSFLVDNSGHILAMPEQGYSIFGLQPEETPVNETPKQTILDAKSDALKSIAEGIVSGNAGVMTIPVNQVDNYVAIAPLPTTNYRLAIFAPSKELNGEIIKTRNEIQSEVQTSLRFASAILIVLFVGALVISLWVGRIITRPMYRLTKTVEEITSGNISARVKVESQDETGVLARAFNTMAERLNDTLLGLEERISERTQELEKINESNAYRATQFESIAQISRTISSTQTLDTLLPQIAETISERLGFYHVGIFLLDHHREYAVLVAANSAGGKKMLERNHRLQVGETGIVGYVAKTGQPRLALDVGLDAVFFNNPDLPETRSEIALPLRIGVTVFGALDVQSKKAQAFSQEDVSILSSLAEQVSVAIQNARSYQESQEALAQAEIISMQLSEQQWSKFLTRQTIGGYYFDGVDAKQINPTSEKTTPHSLSIPLILRGTKIGTLKLNAPDPNRIWTDEEISLAQATADRTALAIENARLLQDAQKRAAKERTIGEISSKIGSLVNLENIVQTTIEELGSTLPGTEIAIQFTPPKPEQY
ncbi:MAG: GAF domain-containing protein [Anaerolineales bacterium]